MVAWKDKFYNKENKKTTGFTLVELVVAIAILGIIITIALPVVNGIQVKNEKKKYVSYEESIISSAKLYIDSYGEDKFNKRDLNTQCASIKFEELKSRNLLKSYNLDGVECTGTGDDIAAYVVREESGNYKYYPTIICKKNGEEVVYQTTFTVPTVCKNIDNNKIAQIRNVPSCISNSNDAKLTLAVDSDENKRIVELGYSLIDSVSSDNQGLIKKLEYTKIDDLNNLANISLSFADKIVQKEENKNYKLVLKYRYVDSDYQYEVLSKTITVNYIKPQIKVIAKKYDSNIDIKNIKQYDDYKNNTWTNKNVYVTATATDACGKKIDIILSDGSSKEKVETNVIAEDQKVKTQKLAFKTKYGNDKIAEKKFSVKIDKEKPLCGITVSGTKGDNDWYTSDVRLDMSKDDKNGSGIAGAILTTSDKPSYNGTIVTGNQTDNTKKQNWYGYVKDKAGNVNECYKTIKVDKNSPTCSISASGTKGDNNWYTSNVKLTMTNGTSTSGIAGYKLTTSKTPSYNKKNLTAKQTDNTKKQKWYGYIKNNAGRVNTCDITLKVDKDPPKFVEKLDMTTCGITNDHGYYKFGYTFTDNLSGISTNNAYFKYCYQIEEGEQFSGNTCSNNGYGNATYNWDNANDGALSGKFLSGVSICLSRKSAVEVIKADLKICDRAGNCSTKKASYTPPKNKCDTLKPWPCAD